MIVGEEVSSRQGHILGLFLERRIPPGLSAAATVDSSQFLPAAQLRQWHEELDDMGLRATGSPIHEHYIDVLISRGGWLLVLRVGGKKAGE